MPGVVGERPTVGRALLDRVTAGRRAALLPDLLATAFTVSKHAQRSTARRAVLAALGLVEPAADAAAAAADGSPVGDRDDTAYADRERAARLDHAASLVGGRPASRAGGMGGGAAHRGQGGGAGGRAGGGAAAPTNPIGVTSPVAAPGAPRAVLVHASGFRQSPYADTRPPGEDPKSGVPPRKLWHASPGSSGH